MTQEEIKEFERCASRLRGQHPEWSEEDVHEFLRHYLGEILPLEQEIQRRHERFLSGFRKRAH